TLRLGHLVEAIEQEEASLPGKERLLQKGEVLLEPRPPQLLLEETPEMVRRSGLAGPGQPPRGEVPEHDPDRQERAMVPWLRLFLSRQRRSQQVQVRPGQAQSLSRVAKRDEVGEGALAGPRVAEE